MNQNPNEENNSDPEFTEYSGDSSANQEQPAIPPQEPDNQEEQLPPIQPQAPYHEQMPPQNPYSTPQPYAYGNPFTGYTPPPGAGGPTGNDAPLRPLPLAEAIKQLLQQYWRVLSHPSPATFAAETSKAAWNIVLVQIIGYAILGSIISTIFVQVLYTKIFFSLFNSISTLPTTGTLPPTSFLHLYQSFLLSTSFSNVVAIPIYFFVGVLIQYGLAKLFKGQGSYLVQCYASLLYQIPVGLIMLILLLLAVLFPVPAFFVLLGLVMLIGFALGIYSIVLNIFAIMSVHRLRGGQASAVVLIPYGVYFLVVCGFTFFSVLLGIIVGASQATPH